MKKLIYLGNKSDLSKYAVIRCDFISLLTPFLLGDNQIYPNYYINYTRHGRHGFELLCCSLLFLSFDHKLFPFDSFVLEITRNALLSLIRNGLMASDRIDAVEIGRRFSFSALSLLICRCFIFVNLNSLDVKYSKAALAFDFSDDLSDVVDVTQHSEAKFCVADGDGNIDDEGSDSGRTAAFRL